MPTPSAIFTELVSTTLRNRTTEVSDNISLNNALYTRMQKKGNIQTEDGGTEIVRALDYAENSTFKRFSGFDTLPINASDVITAAKYNWTNYSINIVASGEELRQNSGKNQMINLAKARITNAKRTAANNMSVDLYSSGALSNQIGGLAHIIQTNGQGTVGGIDSATYTFWRNKFREIAGTNTWTSATIKGEMNALWLDMVRGNDKPDTIVMSHDFYAAYEASLQDQQRWTSSDMAEAGFETLKFKSADVIFDSNTNFSTTAERAYFLNTNYLYLIEHKDARWSMKEERVSLNQDATVIPLIWMGQLVCTNRAQQGILIDAA